MQYTFRKKHLIVLMWVIDHVGALIFRVKRVSVIEPKPIHVLVLRLDHIGDIVLAEPMLRELRFHRPEVRLTLITSHAGEALFSATPGIEAVHALDVAWFQGGSWFKSMCDWFRLRALIKRLPADAIVDLRGDCRHLAAARSAQTDTPLLSYGTTGCGFLLSYEEPYCADEHAAWRNMRFLRPLGVRKSYKTIPLVPFIASATLDEGLELPPSDVPWIALHVGVGTPAKAWPAAHWRELVQCLNKRNERFFFIGDKVAQKTLETNFSRLKLTPRFVNLCGRLELSQLGSFLRRCAVLISADSGPVHIASAQNIESIVLYSGTNQIETWRPLGDKVTLLTHKVSCSPCHAVRCPKARHDCMEGIEPEAVLKKLDILMSARKT